MVGVAQVSRAHTKLLNSANCIRYTMFYPLYPIGIGAEWWLLYRAIAPGSKTSAVIPPIFYFCLMLYIPGLYSDGDSRGMSTNAETGSYKMYTYMIKQRKKVMR